MISENKLKRMVEEKFLLYYQEAKVLFRMRITDREILEPTIILSTEICQESMQKISYEIEV